MSFTKQFINESTNILSQLNCDEIEKMVSALAKIKQFGGRLFILGVGGSAGTASHAVNDFRKICAIQSYTPTDNVSELTARINDEGFESCFSAWLNGSKLTSRDAVLILSVGGGNIEKNISMNLVKAIDYAKHCNSAVLGIVGKDGGYTRQQADVCVVIPPTYFERVTPHTEGLCGVILHLLVSHPDLKSNQTKWESVK